MTGPLIYDVGFNVGQDTAYYLSRGARVIAVEADPTLAAAGTRRFHDAVQAGRLEIVNAGIAAVTGEAEFWLCDDKPEFNSFVRGIAARDGYRHHSIRIPTLTFGSILKRFGIPEYLKIDIEGHDMLCLDALSPDALPHYVSIESECPEDDTANALDEGLRAVRRLHELGYRQFKLIDQRTFCSLSVPPSLNYLRDRWARRWLQQPPLSHLRGTYGLSRHLVVRDALERRFRREFPMGCSGVWGDDTPGPWLNLARAERAYHRYRDLHFESGAKSFHSFWCDWHAKA